jgi:hypothetical protein
LEHARQKTALSYELKKYINFISRKAQSKVQAMNKPQTTWVTLKNFLIQAYTSTLELI